MKINWRAVFAGFIVAWTLGLIASWLFPVEGATTLVNVVPGLVGGFVAGYMVLGLRGGVLHGALATSIGGLITLAVLLVADVLTGSLTYTLGAFLSGLYVVLGQAIPGALAGGFGGWAHRRSTRTEAPTTETR